MATCLGRYGSERTGPVFAPTLHSSCTRESASVSGTGRKSYHVTGQIQHVDRGEPGRRRSVPQLAISIRSPALDTTTQYGGAGVPVRCGNGGHSSRETEYVHRSIAVAGCPVSELPRAISTPALHSARAGQNASI